jgi:hypothetical protein
MEYRRTLPISGNTSTSRTFWKSLRPGQKSSRNKPYPIQDIIVLIYSSSRLPAQNGRRTTKIEYQFKYRVFRMDFIHNLSYRKIDHDIRGKIYAAEKKPVHNASAVCISAAERHGICFKKVSIRSSCGISAILI